MIHAVKTGLACAALALLAAPPAHAQGWGTVKGQVSWGGQ
jgi:hypothetical protein